MVHPWHKTFKICHTTIPDQLSHCVIQGKFVNSMKYSAYYTNFNMNNQRDTFNDIDTFNIT